MVYWKDMETHFTPIIQNAIKEQSYIMAYVSQEMKKNLQLVLRKF